MLAAEVLNTWLPEFKSSLNTGKGADESKLHIESKLIYEEESYSHSI